MVKKKTTEMMMKLRLEGKSISAIADECSCSRQNVSRVLATFTQYDVKDEPVLNELPDEALKMCIDIYAVKCSSLDELVAALPAYSRKELATVLSVLQGRRTYYDKQDTVGYYSALNEWRSKENVSIRVLAEEAGISTVRLGAILAGKLNMPYEYAEKLSALTGLSISDIYDDARQISEVLAVKEAKNEEKFG